MSDVDDLMPLTVESESRRAGLTIDTELFDVVDNIAKVNSLSWSSTAVKLIRRGIDTLKRPDDEVRDDSDK